MFCERRLFAYSKCFCCPHILHTRGGGRAGRGKGCGLNYTRTHIGHTNIARLLHLGITFDRHCRRGRRRTKTQRSFCRRVAILISNERARMRACPCARAYNLLSKAGARHPNGGGHTTHDAVMVDNDDATDVRRRGGLQPHSETRIISTSAQPERRVSARDLAVRGPNICSACMRDTKSILSIYKRTFNTQHKHRAHYISYR